MICVRLLSFYRNFLMPSLDVSHLQLPPAYLVILRELLSEYVPQAQVWAYGSRVSGGCHECSDLDLVLRTPEDLSASCEGRLALQSALEVSALPILVDVHDWPHLPPEFHRNIERAYVQLQQGGRDA
ncbi:MAG: hypothetical protein RLZZ612_2128 [Pseudomonadota bacterium]|jgi:predicted nucleotidyltransferase